MTATWRLAAALAATALLGPAGSLPRASADAPAPAGISRTAADACNSKVVRLQEFAAAPDPAKKQTTDFSESEINSYLALELSSKYHASLKSLELKFEEAKLRGSASIDFDELQMRSKGVLAKLFTRLFSGTHNLNLRGKLRAESGMGNFELEEAQFDDTTLPNFLVEEIITAVGRKQKPPFDPMKPSHLPFGIESVDVRPGHVLVHQQRS